MSQSTSSQPKQHCKLVKRLFMLFLKLFEKFKRCFIITNMILSPQYQYKNIVIFAHITYYYISPSPTSLSIKSASCADQCKCFISLPFQRCFLFPFPTFKWMSLTVVFPLCVSGLSHSVWTTSNAPLYVWLGHNLSRSSVSQATHGNQPLLCSALTGN